MSDRPPYRCGHVAVVGRTNSGKSTLVNALVGEKVAIVSHVPQTTRTIIIGVRNEPDAQLILVDTPGFHKPLHAMNRRMMDEASGSLHGVDAAVIVIDASGRPGKGDDFVIERVRASGTPFVLVLNKVDAVRPKSQLLPLMERMAETGAAAVVPLSARDGDGLEGLLAELRLLLPESPAVYPRDITTDQTERFLIAELIREKVLLATREEVPHATTVLVESVQESELHGAPFLHVEAILAVEKDNQKGILIGKGGDMLKRLGTAARLDIERELGLRCHLGLHVAVMPRWRDDERVLDRVFTGTRALMVGTESLEDAPEGDDE